MTPRPHEALFRSAFEHPDHAAAELRHVLPRALVEAEGKAEGRRQRETLVKLLTLKFGTLDDPTSARIQSASPTELEQWIERILTATHLAAVFEPS